MAASVGIVDTTVTRLSIAQRTGPLAESWRVVSQYFGPGSEIIDNIVERQDRVHFYRLEEAGFLESRQEENHLPVGNNGSTGRLWRTSYWRIKPVKPSC